MAIFSRTPIHDGLELSSIEESLFLVCPICRMDMEISVDIKHYDDKSRSFELSTDCCGLHFRITEQEGLYACIQES